MFGRRPLLHWVLLLALVAMWGSSFMLTKVAVSALSPSSVVAGRVAIATVILGIAMVFVGRRLPRWGRHWVFFIAMAVMGNCLPFWLISWGQRGIDSGLAGILMAVMPLATLVLAHVFVEGERLTPARAAGFATGFAGVVVLIGPEAVMEVAGAGSHLLSELAVLGGALCYAVATIIARRRPDGDALVAATGVAIAASAIMAPMAMASAAAAGGPLVSPIPAASLAAVAILGVVSTALATVVYFKLIALAGPSFLSLINYLIPLWAVLVGMAVLDERPDWTALAALALVLLGIALSELKRSPAK
jgi:drug/metabolite transporter (DMT)-like permease